MQSVGRSGATLGGGLLLGKPPAEITTGGEARCSVSGVPYTKERCVQRLRYAPTRVMVRSATETVVRLWTVDVRTQSTDCLTLSSHLYGTVLII